MSTSPSTCNMEKTTGDTSGRTFVCHFPDCNSRFGLKRELQFHSSVHIDPNFVLKRVKRQNCSHSLEILKKLSASGEWRPGWAKYVVGEKEAALSSKKIRDDDNEEEEKHGQPMKRKTHSVGDLEEDSEAKDSKKKSKTVREFPFTCDWCDAPFFRGSDLLEHHLAEHVSCTPSAPSKQRTSMRLSCAEESPVSGVPEQKAFVCCFMCKSSLSVTHLKNHLKAVHGVADPLISLLERARNESEKVAKLTT